jgi:FkbM family methyltransferase
MTEQKKWEKVNGDFTKILDYPLNEDSTVIELGGYIGEWTKKITKKFNPNMLIIEPVPIFYKTLVNNFSHNKKLIFENSAISTEEKKIRLHVYHSSTSEHNKLSNNTVEVDAYPIGYYLEKHKIEKIDLIQINIECEEFPLLLSWINDDVLNKIKYIQVQFHTFCENYQERYNLITEGLERRGFKIRYRYSFVWEAWENTNIN